MRSTALRRQPEGYISPAQARRFTGLSDQALAKLGREGALTCIIGEGKSKVPTGYLKSEIDELRLWKKGRNSIPALQRACLEARLTAKRALQAVERLEQLLCVKSNRVGLGEGDVVALMAEATQILDERSGEVVVDTIYRWGVRMIAMDEAFLLSCRDVLGSPRPWMVLQQLGEYFARCGSYTRHDPLMATALGYLEAGRRNLRNIVVIIEGGHVDAEEQLLRLIQEINV